MILANELTQFQILLRARQQLSHSTKHVMLENELLRAMSVLPDEEAQNFNQIREYGGLLKREGHVLALLQVEEWLEQTRRRVDVEGVNIYILLYVNVSPRVEFRTGLGGDDRLWWRGVLAQYHVEENLHRV